MNNPLSVLRCESLAKAYREGKKNEVSVLKKIHLSVKQGESLSIVGASGSGKSTLLHLLGGLDHPTSGRVFLMGEDLFSVDEKMRGFLRNTHLGFVYQFHHLLAEFTALENVAMPLLIRRTCKKEAEERACAMLACVGLSHRFSHRPSELSGGERQRAAIARALVTEPSCLLADEPTGNLDRKTASDIFDLMIGLNRSQKTALIIVTHDLNLAARTDRNCLLEDGIIENEPL